MNIQLLLNGNLEMSCSTKKEQKEIKKHFRYFQQSYSESIFIREHLEPRGYSETTPEEHGCLTSAPMITNGKDVWGYMDYQIRSFIEELFSGKKIIWQKG